MEIAPTRAVEHEIFRMLVEQFFHAELLTTMLAERLAGIDLPLHHVELSIHWRQPALRLNQDEAIHSIGDVFGDHWSRSGTRRAQAREPYPRPPDLSWIAMAKWDCGASHRHIAPRVPGSSGDLQRDAPATNSYRLCGVLQSSAHAHGITERCALASSSPTLWRHLRHSDLGWTAPPIRPDIIFGKDNATEEWCRLLDPSPMIGGRNNATLRLVR